MADDNIGRDTAELPARPPDPVVDICDCSDYASTGAGAVIVMPVLPRTFSSAIV
jgi:hypothetical protein